jgi:hypothetical protein
LPNPARAFIAMSSNNSATVSASADPFRSVGNLPCLSGLVRPRIRYRFPGWGQVSTGDASVGRLDVEPNVEYADGMRQCADSQIVDAGARVICSGFQ